EQQRDELLVLAGLEQPQHLSDGLQHNPIGVGHTIAALLRCAAMRRAADGSAGSRPQADRNRTRPVAGGTAGRYPAAGRAGPPPAATLDRSTRVGGAQKPG